MIAWLLANPKLAGKVAAGLLVLIAVAWVAHTVSLWRSEAARVPELERQIKTAADVLDTERQNRRKADEVSNAYQTELRQLRAEYAAAARDRGPVRLCREPARVPATGPAAGRPDAATGGPLPGTPGPDPQPVAGPDVGPDLYALAQDADACSIQLVRLQGWVRETR